MTVCILDNFLAILNSESMCFPHSYLYLLGITSLFIASKYEEVQAIPLEMIVSDIGHN